MCSYLILRTHRNPFAPFLVISQIWHMDIPEILRHEVDFFPWSLTTSFGSLGKPNKAALSKFLEDVLGCLTSLPLAVACITVVIIDAITILQMVTTIPGDFADLVDLLVTEITEMLTFAGTWVEFLADKYPDFSIKNIKRRGKSWREEEEMAKSFSPVAVISSPVHHSRSVSQIEPMTPG